MMRYKSETSGYVQYCKYQEIDRYKVFPYDFMIELLSILLSNNDFELDDEEKQKHVYVLYLKIINFGYDGKKSEEEMKKIQNGIQTKIYDKSGFSLLKYKKKIMTNEIFADGLIEELFKFKNWITIFENDKRFFEDFVIDIFFYLEYSKGNVSTENKSKFLNMCQFKSLKGYKSFQNKILKLGNSQYFCAFENAIKKLLGTDICEDIRCDWQKKFIFDTNLLLKLAEKWLSHCLGANHSVYKFLFQSNFVFVLPVNEITADNVNSAFRTRLKYIK